MEKQYTGLGTFVSAAFASLSWVEQVDTILRWGAAAAAIFAGIATGVYYIRRRL